MAARNTGIRTLSIFLRVQEACDTYQYQIITNKAPSKQSTISAGKYTVSTGFSQT